MPSPQTFSSASVGLGGEGSDAAARGAAGSVAARWSCATTRRVLPPLEFHLRQQMVVEDRETGLVAPRPRSKQNLATSSDMPASATPAWMEGPGTRASHQALGKPAWPPRRWPGPPSSPRPTDLPPRSTKSFRRGFVGPLVSAGRPVSEARVRGSAPRGRWPGCSAEQELNAGGPRPQRNEGVCTCVHGHVCVCVCVFGCNSK